MKQAKPTATKKLTKAERNVEAIAEVRRLLAEVRALRAMLTPLENRQAETRRQLESLIAR
jgi:hypothetical protein